MKLTYSDIFVAISTDKIEVLVDFYSQLLQQQPTVYRPLTYGEFQLKKLRIGIFQPKPEHQAEFNHNGKSSISFCLEVASLEEAISCVSNLGYPPPGKIIEASHGQEIYAYDPTGNRIILHQSRTPE
ncbi:MAG: VOC family protein [Cyanobacteria bacterium P01_G01_bin.67]